MSFSDLEIVGRNVLKIYEFSQCCRPEKAGKEKDHRRQVGFTYKIAAMTGGKNYDYQEGYM